MGGGIGVEFVEVRDAHGEIGVGEEFDGFGLSRIREKNRDVFLDGAFFEEARKDLGTLRAFADNDARWMQVVVKRTAFTQEFRREDEVLSTERCTSLHGVAHGDGRFDDHRGVGIDGHDVADNGFNGFSIEVVGFRVVVRRGGDDDVVRPFVSFFLIQRGAEVQRFVLEVVLKFMIFNGRLFTVDLLNLLGNDVQGDHFMVLREQHAVGQTYVTCSGNGDFHATLSA